MADKDDGIGSALGDLAEAVGNDLSTTIPGADAGQDKDSPDSSESTPESTPSASGDTHDGSDGSDSDTATPADSDAAKTDEGDGLLGAVRDVFKAVGDDLSHVIPGADAGQSNDSPGPSDSAPSASGSGTHYGSDYLYSDTAETSDDGKTVRRDNRANEVKWESEVRGDRIVHWEGGRNQSVNPTHFTIDRGNGTHDHYRYSDNAPVGSSIVQPDGSVNDYDPDGNYTGHRSAE